ncbi:hypothetical protein PENANT_c001G05970 [Penicillium antarcticum]|uniref:Uncharacterized protein n=1 Tax=Penicillium antarcticum TaxID=416450 RepID=A0A1V6QP70_9EURO|nr:uncharacterized protein N7508_010328 [Penicillium antarcticum]KAJ5295507.1 hypothetical protein N7508_010328 [Penicillium antarcticum]OQD90995.1 hypothetical protein PENANT_c001G05970 [Penicillium antarcticum]
MECFRQVFRCVKAPFTRNKGRIIEIGPPTNFRKEELPACFSDAESVLSPNQPPTVRPDLTDQSQHADVAGQSDSDRREERSHDRDGVPPTIDIDEEQGSEPCPQNEPQTVTPRRERIRLPRWWKSSSAIAQDSKAPAESITMDEVRTV